MYVGEFRYNKRNGEGKFVYCNGNIYIGTWKNDMRHGHGVLKFANTGDVYEGLWKNDKMDNVSALRFTISRPSRMTGAGFDLLMNDSMHQQDDDGGGGNLGPMGPDGLRHSMDYEGQFYEGSHGNAHEQSK